MIQDAVVVLSWPGSGVVQFGLIEFIDLFLPQAKGFCISFKILETTTEP